MLDNRLVLKKTLNLFVVSLLVATAGLFLLGPLLPPAYATMLSFGLLILLIVTFWIRKKSRISKTFLFIFTGLSGTAFHPVLTYYVGDIGGPMVGVALFTTAVIMLTIGTISWKSKIDFTFLGGFLLAAIIALILVSILFLFIPATTWIMWGITIAGILIFVGFILYDISVIKNGSWAEEDIPLLALNLYLDFINLFRFILSLIGLASSDD